MESLFLDLFIKSREKAEKKLKNSTNFKVQTTKSFRIFALCFWLVIIAVMILLLLTEFSVTSLLISAFLGVFSLLPAFGYLNARFNYYDVSEENIVHHRLFGKSTTIEYSDIFYIQYRSKGNPLSAYNKNGTMLFHIDSLHMGIERLTDILEEKGIHQETSELITEEMKNSNEYQLRQKREHIVQALIITVSVLLVAAVIIAAYLYDAMR